jgi:putative ABC transport system substrate-binding protein
MILRHEFIAGLGSAVAWPLAARAQQGDRVRHIGVLMAGDENDPRSKTIVSSFTQALADLGWIEGRNARLDARWPGGDINLIRAHAHELVGLRPDIIVANSTPATVAVQRETRTIPIVFVALFDPVASSIVPRLDHPGGNITGFVSYEATLGGKWLELLSEIAPGLKRAAIMFNPDLAPLSAYMPSLETAARSLKVEQIIRPVRSDIEIESDIRDLGRSVRMDDRWGGGDANRIRALAQELVGLQSDIIVATSTPATAALQRETRTIPIVFVTGGDPVASGIVAQLDRPSRNVTGFGILETSLGGKWLELLSEIAPGLKRAAIMFNPDTSPASIYMPSFETGYPQ